MPEPVYWECGGGPGVSIKWGYGFWTGPDNDLLCVKPNILSNKEAEKYLSPICKTRAEAKKSFEAKRIKMGVQHA